MKAVVFDLDGVLVDSAALFSSVVQKVLGDGDHPVSTEAVLRARVANVEQWVGALLPRAVASRTERIRKLSARVRAQVTRRSGELKVAPGALRLLSAIAAVHHLFMLTNSSSAYARAILSRHRLEGLFKRVITSDDPFGSKEDAIAFIAKSYSLALRDVIYVGDTIKDIACAKIAGCRALIAYTPWSWDWGRLEAIRAAGPDIVVEALDAIADLLEE